MELPLSAFHFNEVQCIFYCCTWGGFEKWYRYLRWYHKNEDKTVIKLLNGIGSPLFEQSFPVQPGRHSHVPSRNGVIRRVLHSPWFESVQLFKQMILCPYRYRSMAISTSFDLLWMSLSFGKFLGVNSFKMSKTRGKIKSIYLISFFLLRLLLCAVSYEMAPSDLNCRNLVSMIWNWKFAEEWFKSEIFNQRLLLWAGTS